MLRSLDVLIGFAAIMLFVSMGVTFLTQMAIQLFRSRSRHLVNGLVDVLKQIDPKIPGEIAQTIALRVVEHPLIRGSKLRRGAVVRRDELTSLLLQMAADPPPNTKAEDMTAFAKLAEILKARGIPDPGETWRRVQLAALELEKASPEMASNARQSAAILREASSEFVAKLNMHFDSVMDRVTERFTYSTRVLTFVGAAIVAVALQLDSVSLINRLESDEKTRDAFVQEAIRQNSASGAAFDQQYGNVLASTGVIDVPATYADWYAHWASVNLGGVAISMLLLTLGAPFWYGILGNLVKLRSTLAQKDDDERKERQTQTAALAPQGERGDTNAQG